jgi:hypothetical protein
LMPLCVISDGTAALEHSRIRGRQEPTHWGIAFAKV